MRYKLTDNKFIFKISELSAEEQRLASPVFRELLDNALAFQSDSGDIEIPVVEILKLDSSSKKLLGLPPECPYALNLYADNLLQASDFSIQFRFLTFYPGGEILPFQKHNCIIEIHERHYLLSLDQYLAIEKIEVYKNLTGKTLNSNLLHLGEIKKTINLSNTYFDSVLESEDVVIPEKIYVEATFENGELKIFPRLNDALSEDAQLLTDIQDKKYSERFQKKPSVPESINLDKENGGRIRILNAPEISDDLQKLKEHQLITNASEIRDFVENPAKILNSDHLNLDFFYSDRVKELGILKPKFTTFVTPYKSEWIPGFFIEDSIEGDRHITLDSIYEADELSVYVENAIHEGSSEANFKNETIPLDKAQELLDIARRQLADKSKPLDPSLEHNAPKYLILKDNNLELQYEDEISSNEIQHIFYEINNLREGINLKDHQKEGVAWLQSLYLAKQPGCLLADDMGLGKTIQLLYFIEWLSSQSDKPVLVCAPISLLSNWESEYNKFFDSQSYKIELLYGAHLKRFYKGYHKEYNQEDAARLQKKKIILTNYETVRGYQFCLGLVDFATVVLDEAQKIKTNGTLVTQSVKALKADFKIAMTGTPVENTLMDIWSIMDFCVSGLLNSEKNFYQKYHKPVSTASYEEQKRITDMLRSEIGIFFKRRLKKDVAKDLPAKFDNADSRRKIPMSAYQFEKYKSEISKIKNDSINKSNMLTVISNLKGISDHPDLNSELDYSSDIDQIINNSAKLKETVSILNDIVSKEEKVILFAERRNTQQLLYFVINRLFGLEPHIINGDTPTTENIGDSIRLSRQAAIDLFHMKKGFNVIIMSPIAAGVGLNVVGANHVIHYSRHWNPAKESQATDRAYRIGQTKDVYVYYPMAVFPKNVSDDNSKSFDEVLDSLLSNKKILAENTLFPTDQAEILPADLLSML